MAKNRERKAPLMKIIRLDFTFECTELHKVLLHHEHKNSCFYTILKTSKQTKKYRLTSVMYCGHSAQGTT